MVHYCMYYMNITYINLYGSLLYGDTTVSMAFRRIWVVSSVFFFCHRGRKGLRKLAKLQRRGKHRVGLREANTLRCLPLQFAKFCELENCHL